MVQKTNSLNRKLAAYSAAATLAVGAGVVHAAGQLIDVDPNAVLLSGDSLDIDFDQDGNPEFLIFQTSIGTEPPPLRNSPSNILPGPGWALLSTTSNAGDRGLGAIGYTSNFYYYASNLATGAPINGAVGNWQSVGSVTLGYDTQGQFPGAGRGYVGVKFNLNGAGPYYGWIELEVNANSTQTTVYGYYYDDAQQGVPAGQTPLAVSLREVSSSVANNPVGIASLLTAATAALSGLGLLIRRRLWG